jgi:hypothetical protein
MTAEPTLTLTCPRCQHTWREQLSALEKLDQEIFKGQAGQKSTFRARCPQDHTYLVVEVLVKEDDRA